MESINDKVIELEALREAYTYRKAAGWLLRRALVIHHDNKDVQRTLQIAAEYLSAEAYKLTAPYKSAN